MVARLPPTTSSQSLYQMSTPTGQAALMEALAAHSMSADKGMLIMPFFISCWIDAVMMGLVISQAYAYWTYARTDKKHIVLLVFLTVAGAIASTIIDLLWTQYLFVWNFGTYLPFADGSWLIKFLGTEIFTVLVVQIFYVDRACRLFSHWWPAAVTGPFILAMPCLGISLLHHLSTFPYLTPDVLTGNNPLVDALAYSWLTVNIVADVLITGIIVYGLSKVRTGWAHTDSVLRKLSIQCFESQIPALIGSIVSLIAWNKVFELALTVIIIQSKVYVLGLLITLNLRAGNRSTTINASFHQTSSGPKDTAYHMNAISSARSESEAHLNDQKSPWSTSDRYVKPTDEETDCTGSLHEHRMV
ncbi:uncharacterized protein MKK02DRAFT_33333 [Dioszegia hungarica]|uniref:DUF6534 domain-containing protein n=1 Tax=Dioszegia hungarica TaxID=4972 RepID=A0AA38HAX6_9TREE|nr:uncharacterized protein MKK02DRAFT_33333 [Dioszegia hungarica]KAI9636049.1 hypothetical protein MKK02DRAFT_33333 [Dioszegia hungarica]